MRDFRLYMLVGGMPQAVDTYIPACISSTFLDLIITDVK